MQQDEIVTQFLNASYKELWTIIIKNDIAAILQQVTPQRPQQSLLSKLFNRKPEEAEANKLYQIVHELFAFGQSKTLTELEFEIMNAESVELFQNLTRLLFAVDINDSHQKAREIVSDVLYNATSKIAEEISEKSDGYPLEPINGQVWVGGSGMRNAFFYLAYYYQKKGQLQSQLWVAKSRTYITLSIMSHYKEMVGPDMIAVARLEETLGLHEDALGKYKAVIADFKNETEYFNLDTDVLNESECATLSSLLESYQSVDRIENTANYSKEVHLLKQLLDRTNMDDEESHLC